MGGKLGESGVNWVVWVAGLRGVGWLPVPEGHPGDGVPGKLEDIKGWAFVENGKMVGERPLAATPPR